MIAEPHLYEPNQHFADPVNRNVIQSEIDGGVYLRDLPCGALLEIETYDWTCLMIYCGEREALVRGHPWICPNWVKVSICGSTWGGSMIKDAFIGRGMFLEFLHPRYHRIVTSPIRDIRMNDLLDRLTPGRSGSAPAIARR